MDGETMSKMAELDMVSYDIEQLYIEGMTEKNIAKTLDISVEMVYAWMELNGMEEAEQGQRVFDHMVQGIQEFSPFETVNS
jgi:uncharacterized protein YjcR